MARTSGYRRSGVWRPCGVPQHAALQNKSVVCSGSRVTNSTVMKLHGSDNRGEITVKRIQRALAHICLPSVRTHLFCSYAALSFWNTFPCRGKSSDTLLFFKLSQISHLFKIPDENTTWLCLHIRVYISIGIAIIWYILVYLEIFSNCSYGVSGK